MPDNLRPVSVGKPATQPVISKDVAGRSVSRAVLIAQKSINTPATRLPLVGVTFFVYKLHQLPSWRHMACGLLCAQYLMARIIGPRRC
jgi:hypothetical protein